ncbi:hypothetical protein GALL_460050 [mine drainage metagenome]|uniref:Uncharacterized protein n=1 Tax=mine drainage metagenome TaxID=410659 RepID=A0A1J5PXS6_9ZZZZ
MAHVDAEAREQAQRDFDVGFGNQLADDVDDDVGRRTQQRQRQQQRAEELAGDVAAYAQRRVHARRAAAYGQRWVAGISELVDAAAQRAQRVDQIADRALVHARHAAYAVLAADQRQRRGQRPHSGAGVAEEQVGAFDRRAAVAAVDHAVSIVAALDAYAQRAQRVEHHAGVVRVEQPVDAGAAFGQRGQQQQAV